jgi:hypothetical protein
VVCSGGKGARFWVRLEVEKKIIGDAERRAKSATSHKSKAATLSAWLSHASVQFQIALSFVTRSLAALAMNASRPSLKKL